MSWRMSQKLTAVKDLSLIHMSPDLSTVLHNTWGINMTLLILKTLVYDDIRSVIAGMV